MTPLLLALILPPPEFADARGTTSRLPGANDCAGLVLLFLGHDCPISNGYAPEISRLYAEYAPKRVAFRVVYADADLTRARAAKHAADYALPCPALLDPGQILTKRVGAAVKPEAALLSPNGELLYLGRIDNIYVDYGKKRARPTKRELKAAIDALLAGEPVPVARAAALGCPIDFPGK